MCVKMKLFILMAFLAVCFAKQEDNREKKLFSIFSVVQFKNDPCTSSSSISSASTDYRNGTCVTSSECVNRANGHAKGNCAAGFGVCCVIMISDDDNTDVDYNDTYIQNPDYPSAYGDADSISYKVNKINNDVCLLRLDFEMFNIKDVVSTGAGGTGECTDMFTVTTGDQGLSVPTICGDMNGQHIYINMGPDAGDNVDLKFDFTGADTGRKWEIKTAQIPCNSAYTPPDGCLQWYREPTGRITSFNNAQSKTLLPNTNYRSCIRQEAGSCCIEYQECGFMLRTTTDPATPDSKSITGTNCDIEGYVSIVGAGSNCGSIVGTNKFCGDLLNYKNDGATKSIPVIDCTAPFEVNVVTPAIGVAKTNTGFCLDYRQLPCGTC